LGGFLPVTLLLEMNKTHNDIISHRRLSGSLILPGNQLLMLEHSFIIGKHLMITAWLNELSLMQ